MIEVNEEIQILCNKEYKDKPLAVPIGKLNEKENVYMDFTNISGLFIAGTTGTGKSVLIDWIIRGLMYKNTPSDVSFCLIDPKKIELNEYNDLDYVINNVSLSSFNEIKDGLEYINKVIDFRMDKLISNKCRSIKTYNKTSEEKWPHIFVVVDEGHDIVNISEIRSILDKILIYGKNVGLHLIFSTNSYLKDMVESKFIDLFKYKVAFDLASMEQEKLIGIKDSNWLSTPGDVLIKGFNAKKYHFQSFNLDDDLVLLHSSFEEEILE